MVPPVALQATAVLVMPVTVAENCCDAPSTRGTVFGETLTLIVGGGGFCEGEPLELFEDHRIRRERRAEEAI